MHNVDLAKRTALNLVDSSISQKQVFYTKKEQC